MCSLQSAVCKCQTPPWVTYGKISSSEGNNLLGKREKRSWRTTVTVGTASWLSKVSLEALVTWTSAAEKRPCRGETEEVCSGGPRDWWGDPTFEQLFGLHKDCRFNFTSVSSLIRTPHKQFDIHDRYTGARSPWANWNLSKQVKCSSLTETSCSSNIVMHVLKPVTIVAYRNRIPVPFVLLNEFMGQHRFFCNRRTMNIWFSCGIATWISGQYIYFLNRVARLEFFSTIDWSCAG